MTSAPGRRRPRRSAFDEPSGLGMERQVDAEDVGLLGDRGRATARSRPATRPRVLEAEPPEVGGGVVGEASGPDDEVAAERLGAARQLLGDVAEPEQPERRAVQAARLRVLLLVPAAGPQVGDVVRDPPVEREDQAERELGHGDRVPARAVRDVDAADRRGGDVDRVVAGARPDDEGEAPGVHDRLGHLGRADDQHLRLRLGERGRERLVLERRVVHDVAADRGEAVEARSFELVRDEDSHGRCAPIDGSPARLAVDSIEPAGGVWSRSETSVPFEPAMEDAMTQEHGDSYPKLREVLGEEGFAELAHLIRTTYEANEERRLRRDAEGGASPGDAKPSR